MVKTTRRLAGYGLLLSLVPSTAPAEWPQWGGPRRDFSTTEATALRGFPTPGPRVVWDKPLGPGYSAIVTSGERLVTMYRRDKLDVVTCLSRKSGETLWEYAYGAPVPREVHHIDTSYGEGPNSTPLLAEEHAYTISFNGVVNALDLDDGTLAWSHDLAKEFAVSIPYFGHSASPLRHGDTVIFIAGGAFAFDLKSGKLRWQNRFFGGSYASPLLVPRQGGAVLVAGAAGEVVGLDPDSGELLWRHEHANQHRTILHSPLFGPDDRLFVSAYFLGSIGLELSSDGRSVVEAWETPQVQLSHANAQRVGDWIYGFHRSVLTALNVVTGEIGWRHRGLRKSNILRVGERFLLLDAVGTLTLASLTPEGPVIHGETQVFEGRAWTAPTVEGNVLYARDQERIVALDLSRAAAPAAADRGDVAPSREALMQPEFLTAKKELALAVHRNDARALAESRPAFERFGDHAEVAHLAHYYIAYAAWSEAGAAERGRALTLVDEAIRHLDEAVRLHKAFPDAHALLATLYPMYYRLDPERAAVVGPLAGEHLELARLFSPNHPRVALTEGFRLINRPADHGGDLQAGLRRVREALDLFERDFTDSSGVDAGWCRGLAWSWYGQALLGGTAQDRSMAAAAFERALAIEPELTDARRLLAGLREQAPEDAP